MTCSKAVRLSEVMESARPPTPEPLEVRKPCVHRHIRALKSESPGQNRGERLLQHSARVCVHRSSQGMVQQGNPQNTILIIKAPALTLSTSAKMLLYCQSSGNMNSASMAEYAITTLVSVLLSECHPLNPQV